MIQEHETRPKDKLPLVWHMYRQDVSGKDLSQRTKIHPSTISNYRKGLWPTEKNARKIAKALGLDLVHLGWQRFDG